MILSINKATDLDAAGRVGGWRRNLILLTIQTLCLTVLLLSFAGYFGRGRRFMELTSHFKLQYVLTALACLFLIIILRASAAWVVCALLTLALNVAAITPWWYALHPSAQAATTAPHRLKLLLSNVNYGNRSYEALFDLIERESPDIVVCQEVTERWAHELKALRDDYPNGVILPLPNGSGIALLSRLPLSETRVLDLGVESRPAILTKIEAGGTTVTLLALHPPTPLKAEDFAARNRQLSEAAAVLGVPVSGPKILVGDLNTSVWSPYLSDLRTGANLVDARAGSGIFPSWPTWLPPFLRLPIDQCLVSHDIFVREIKTGPRIGSDHLPLIVTTETLAP